MLPYKKALDGHENIPHTNKYYEAKLDMCLTLVQIKLASQHSLSKPEGLWADARLTG
jgi:hypothetical protein